MWSLIENSDMKLSIPGNLKHIHTHTHMYIYTHTHICECIHTYVNKSHIGAEQKNLAWTIGILMDKREKKTGLIVPIINENKFQIDKRFKC